MLTVYFSMNLLKDRYLGWFQLLTITTKVAVNICIQVFWSVKVFFSLGRCWQTFSVKDQIVNIFGIVGCAVSVASIQLCCCCRKQPRPIQKHRSLVEFGPLLGLA